MSDSSLLLDLGVPFKRGSAGLLVEAQALNGMRLWAKHFDRVTVCAPELPQQRAEESTTIWADPTQLLAEGRVRFEPLPWGYHPREHFRFRSDVTRRVEALVSAHRYLCFSNLGAFGAWGNLGAAAAHALGRPYSLWFDWVLHEMHKHEPAPSMWRTVRNSGVAAIVRFHTQRAVRNCSLGLFHGQTVYDAYAPLCRHPELVHDVHVGAADVISDKDLAAKIADTGYRKTLRVGYAGRVHPMKAPLDWIDTMAQTATAIGSERLQATWLGDGPLLEAARHRVAELGLQGRVRFIGFVSDRAQVLSFLRQQDVFVFCHLTPESPRCLIEALISGTPLVGYDNSYARELVGGSGAAVLTPARDTTKLGQSLARLAQDRGALAYLVRQTAGSRALFNDEAVFAHRSDLIKKYLP